MYLTREQAVAELTRDGSDEKSAHAVLDWAIRIYPRSHRTSFEMITGYAAGTIMGPYTPGHPGIPADLFTVSPW